MSIGDFLRNAVKDKLARGEIVSSMTVRLARTPEIARIAATAGFDMLYIDLEHSALTLDAAAQICMAAQDLGLTGAVRVPANNPEYISRMLDIGAMGIIAPHVRNAAEAQAVIQAAKLPPQGERSNTGLFPQLHYKALPAAEIGTTINAATLVIVQIESSEALENADTIASVEGVDILLVGLNDLLGSLGLAGQYDHPKVDEIYQKVIDCCRRHGKHCGVGGLANRLDLMERYARMGARYISSGTDLSFLMNTAVARAAQIKTFRLD